jgi:hypothetical protein
MAALLADQLIEPMLMPEQTVTLMLNPMFGVGFDAGMAVLCILCSLCMVLVGTIGFFHDLASFTKK